VSFTATATPELYPLSLHDALPISAEPIQRAAHAFKSAAATIGARGLAALLDQIEGAAREGDVSRAREAMERVRREAQAALDYLRSEEHMSELQSRRDLVCRLLLEK